MRVVRIAESGFRALTFAPQGNLFATGHQRGAVRLWDPRTATELASVLTGLYTVENLVFSPTADRLIASQWGRVMMWNITGTPEAPQLKPHRTPSGQDDGMQMALPALGSIQSTSVGFLPDSELLVGGDGTRPLIYYWPLNGSAPWLRSLDNRAGGIWQMALNNAGSRIATTDRNTGMVRLWTAQGGIEHPFPSARNVQFPIEAPLCEFPHSALVTRIRFSPDDQFLATLAGRTLRIWNLETEQCVVRLIVSQMNPLAMEYSPSGRTIATAGNNREIIFWDALTGERRTHFAFQIGKISQLAFNPDATIAAAGGMTRKLVLWDLEDV